MRTLRLTNAVALVTDRADSAKFKIGLDGVESGTGRRLPTATTDFDGIGTAFQTGDLLFGKLRPYLAKTWLADRPGAAVGDFLVLRPKSDSCGRYLNYVLLSEGFLAPLVASATGAKMPRTDWAEVKDSSIFFPAFDEQCAIADYLDQETAQIDALVAKQEKFIRLLRQKRIAQITNSVCRGLDESVHLVPSGADWFDAVPVHWNVRRLKTSIQDAQAGAWGADPVGDGTDVNCVRVADFDRPSLMVGHVPTLRSVNAKDYHPRALRPGDLLLEKSGGTALNPVGFVAMYEGDHERAVSSNFITRLRLKNGQDSRFWLYAHAASYGTRLTARSVKQTTGIQNLDQASYFNELFPFPPLQEQQAIASYLDDWTGRIDALIAMAEELISLAKERRAAIITAAVTGQIDIRTAQKAS